MRFRRTGSPPVTQSYFPPNASARIMISWASRSGRAGGPVTPMASLVSGNLVSCAVFTESRALDMNRVR
jgi:hypothetical protein